MWNRLRFHRSISQIFQRRKSDANKQYFENQLNLTCRAQSTPKTIWILIKVFCTSGSNLVVLAWTCDELSCRQAQNGVNFDFEVKIDLEGQGQTPPKTIGRDLNQGLLQLWSKFGDPSFNGWWVIARTSTWLPHTQTDVYSEIDCTIVNEAICDAIQLPTFLGFFCL